MKTQKSERVSKSDTLHAHSSDQLRDHFNEETEQIRLFHSREPFSWQRLPITGNHWTLQQSFCFLRTTCYDHRNQSAQTVKLSPCTPSAPGPGVTSSSFMFLRKRSQIWKLINFKKVFWRQTPLGNTPPKPKIRHPNSYGQIKCCGQLTDCSDSLQVIKAICAVMWWGVLSWAARVAFTVFKGVCLTVDSDLCFGWRHRWLSELFWDYVDL